MPEAFRKATAFYHLATGIGMSRIRPGDSGVVSVVTLLGLEELVSELGGDLRPLATEIGLDLLRLKDPEQFVPLARVYELLNRAADKLHRKDLGLLWGARSDPSRLGPLHVALMNAKTGRQAVLILARFLHLSFPTATLSLRKLPGQQGELLGMHSALRRGPPMIQFYERRLGSLFVILGLVCGPGFKPKEVWFAHKQNAPLNAYQRVFGIRPQFEMPEYGIVIPQSVLDAARPANDQVREMAVAYLNAQAGSANASTSAQTLHLLHARMRARNPGVLEIARALGLHPRTLQRRLQQEGVSFEALKDDVRRSIAESLLAQPDVRLIDVSLAVHYANTAALTRSCRRWFGEPPSRVRRRLIAQHRSPSARTRLRKARLRAR